MQPFSLYPPLSLSLCLKMAESQKMVFAAFWYSIIGRLLCTNSRKEDQKEEKSGVQIFDLQHFNLYSPHQPMSASLAFTTDAMRLLEEEQFLQLNKKEKDPLKPKQPMPAFFIFRNERRAERKCGWEVIEEWNNMTEKQKKPYEKIAKQNMEKYLEEMEAYKQRKEEGSANPKKEEGEMMKIHKQEALELLKKKEKTKENRQKKKKKKIADPNKPKKPASSFLLFSGVCGFEPSFWNSACCNVKTSLQGRNLVGKTTQLPQFLFNAGFCRDEKIIGITQPICIAAVSVAKWVAEECGVELGQKVGYSVRFDDMTSSSTRIKYMTDGFLLRHREMVIYMEESQSFMKLEALLDPYLSRYAVIIVDEAHADVLLGLLKSAQNVRSGSVNQCPNIDHMKANNGVMMEKKMMLRALYFGSAKAVHVQGRQFPVDILYTYHPEIDCIDAALITIFQIHLQECPGDILVFLTGQEEIEYVENLVQESLRQKADAATNITETSITILRIKYVIDHGLVKACTYCARTGMESLIFVPTSKAQALQRSGCAAREGPGKCFRLYPEIEFEKLRDSTIPEITQCNLSNVILQLKALGVDDILGKEARKNLLEERPGINDSTLNALILVKWKELSEEDKQTWNEKAAGAKCHAPRISVTQGAASKKEQDIHVASQLFMLMDSNKPTSRSVPQVVVVASTDRADAIDPALRRSGRFDTEIEVTTPHEDERFQILKLYTKKLPLDPSVDLRSIAASCNGYVGADLEALCREAAMSAGRKSSDANEEAGMRSLTMDDWKHARSVVGPSITRGVTVEIPKVSWEDIGGLKNLKKKLQQAVKWPLKHSAAFSRLGVSPVCGILLHGPPGGAELYSMYVGEGEALLHNTFWRARLAAPSIIFFDEAEVVAAKRRQIKQQHCRRREASIYLLTKMDGLELTKGILVLAATNRPLAIDAALMRPGHFDLILSVHTRYMKVSNDVDLKQIAEDTELFTGAELEGLCREAGIVALREDISASVVCNRHFQTV
ncbi:unnamed protein product [Camellia sinensis]